VNNFANVARILSIHLVERLAEREVEEDESDLED
jgi:hypothetical protein